MTKIIQSRWGLTSKMVAGGVVLLTVGALWTMNQFDTDSQTTESDLSDSDAINSAPLSSETLSTQANDKVINTKFGADTSPATVGKSNSATQANNANGITLGQVVPPKEFPISDAVKYFVAKDERGPGNLGGPPPMSFIDEVEFGGETTSRPNSENLNTDETLEE